LWSTSEQPSHWFHILLAVPSQQRQVKNERHPVTVDEEQESQKSVYGGLRDNVSVETVAEIDRVDVVAGAKISMCGAYGAAWQDRRRAESSGCV